MSLKLHFTIIGFAWDELYTISPFWVLLRPSSYINLHTQTDAVESGGIMAKVSVPSLAEINTSSDNLLKKSYSDKYGEDFISCIYWF